MDRPALARRIAALLVVIPLIAAAGPVRAQEAPEAEAVPATMLSEFAVCRDVKDREPVGEADSFPADVGQLVCFTRVTTEEAPLVLYHRWYVGEKLVDEITIPVKGSSWRCWSRKSIYSRWSGPCRVEILTEEGDILGVQEFELTAAAASSESES